MSAHLLTVPFSLHLSNKGCIKLDSTLASSSTELTKHTRYLINTTLRTSYEAKFLVEGKKRDGEHGAKSRGVGELPPRDGPLAITPFTPTDSVSLRQTRLPVRVYDN